MTFQEWLIEQAPLLMAGGFMLILLGVIAEGLDRKDRDEEWEEWFS